MDDIRPTDERTANGSSIEELADGRVYALRNLLTLDGRVSAYPGHARGYSVSNCYLLKEPDGACVIDTGYAANEAQISSLPLRAKM